MHAWLALSLIAAAPVPKPFTAVSSVEGVFEYAMPNGMRLLLVPEPSKPVTTVNLTVFVGSRHEGYGEKGMAHLLEHLLFKGTPKFPDANKVLTEHGAEANGSTWFDRTNYFETVSSTDANIEWAIRFEADRLVNCFVAKKDLDTEMTVVRNEFEMGETHPEEVLSDRLLSSAYTWHNYGSTTIGSRSDIERVPIERLQAFYKRHYQPDNALVVVAGKYDEAKVFRWVADSFGRLPKPTRALLSTYTEEPVQDGERSVTVRRVGGTGVLMAGYHVTAGADPDFPAVDALSFLLGNAPSGRLYQQLVETQKAAKVDCTAHQLREPGYFYCQATLKPGDDAAAVRAGLAQLIEQSASKPFSEKEVARAKTALLKDLELQLNATNRIGILISEYVALGDWRMLFVHKKRLEQLTAADVSRVAQKYFKASNRTTAEYVPTEKPDRAEVPPAPDVAALLKDFKGAAGIVQGEAFEASCKNIDARTQRSALSNGLKLALLPKKTRGQTVRVAFSFLYGTEQSLASQRIAAEVAAKLLARGTQKRSRQEFQDALDSLNAQLRVQHHGQTLRGSLEVRRPQLIAALELVAEALRAPAFDAKEFEALKRELLAETERNKADPEAVGFNALERRMTPFSKEHPFYVPGFDEHVAEINALKLEAVRAFHPQFYGAQDGQLAVIGDFDAVEVTKKLDGLLGDFKAKQPYRHIAQNHRPLEAKVDNLEMVDRANAFLGVTTPFALKDSDADYPAMLMADSLLGGGFLNGRLPTRLREKEGLSYSVATFLDTPEAQDDGAWLSGFAIFAPQNAEKVERGFREELAKAVESGFTADELNAARAGLLLERTQHRSDDGALASMWTQLLRDNRTLAFDAEVDDKLSKLTPEQIGQALKGHLDVSTLSMVKVGDFKKVAAPK